MSARKFVHEVLPHLSFPNRTIWWHRSSELLSPFVNFDNLFSFYHNTLQHHNKNIHELGAQFLGDTMENPQIFASSLKKEARNSFAYSHQQSVTIVGPMESKMNLKPPVFGSTVKMVDRIDNNPAQQYAHHEHESLTDFLTESTPFDEDDLLPEPFLWNSEPKCIQVE